MKFSSFPREVPYFLVEKIRSLFLSNSQRNRAGGGGGGTHAHVDEWESSCAS